MVSAELLQLAGSDMAVVQIYEGQKKNTYFSWDSCSRMFCGIFAFCWSNVFFVANLCVFAIFFCRSVDEADISLEKVSGIGMGSSRSGCFDCALARRTCSCHIFISGNGIW